MIGMLCMKAWLEMRWRLLLALAISFSPFLMFAINGVRRLPGATLAVMGFMLAFTSMYLAGAGIKTQPSFQATKGIHGSIYFTLSLPVSRFRLFVTRAAAGLLGTVLVNVVALSAVWILFPSIRSDFSLVGLFRVLITGLCCAAAFSALSVFYATFLDELWQIWGSGLTVMALWSLSNRVLPHSSWNVFHVLSAVSPLAFQAFPVGAIAISLAAAAAFFGAAFAVINAREY